MMQVRRPAVAGGLTIAVVALSGAPAFAAAHTTHTTTTTFHTTTGSDQSDVLRLTLAPPSGAALPLPSGLPSSLDLGVLDVRGTSTSNAKADKHAATAFSGLISPTGTQLDQATSQLAASADEKNPSASLPGSAFPSNPVLGGSALTGTAKVTTSSDGSSSDITVANLSVLQLGQILPSSAFDSLNSGIATLTSNLDTLLSTLQGALPPSPLPAPVDLTTAIASVRSLIGEVAALPANLQKSALVTIGALEGKQSITHGANGLVTSSATTALANLNVLAGLLTVRAVDTSALATASGTPGSADTSPASTVADVTLGKSDLVASLAPDGDVLKISILGLDLSALTSQVTSALAQVQAALNSVLGNIGLSVSPSGTTSKHVAADGTSASSEADGVTVSFAPPALPAAASTAKPSAAAAANPTVLSLALGRSVASVTSTKSLTTVKVAPSRTSAGSPLPDTGGTATPAILGVAFLGVAGVATAVRRRRRLVA